MLLRRKIIGLFFLAIMVTPFCSFLFIEVRQLYIQHEMVEKLEKDHLVTISIPANDVYWFKKNKEIIVNNEMFDVKEYKVDNGFYIFKGLFDSKETAIKKAVASSQKSEDSDTLVSILISIIAFHQSKYCEPEPESFSFFTSYFEFFTLHYKSFLPEIPGPPPKVTVEI